MNDVLRRFAWLACASISMSTACAGAPDAPPDDPAARAGLDTARPPAMRCGAFAAKLQAALDASAKALGIPGVAAGVESPGCSWRGASGIANTQSRTPAKPGDLFRIGSITKSFVSTVVLMLDAEGRISLEDPVSAHVNGVPGGDGITVRQILDHTSGLYDYSTSEAFLRAFDADPTRVWMPAELLALAAAEKPYFAPGKGFHYSNTNYVVAGLLVEAVTGRTVAEELRAHLLGPQGLEHTYFDGEDAPVPGLAHGYELWDNQLVDATWGADLSWAWAAGAMVSNTDDLTRFFGRLFHGELLPAAELQEMLVMTPTRWGGLTGYGLGLTQRTFAGGVGRGHEGGVMGYETAAYYVPELDAVLTALTNLGSGDAANIVDNLSSTLKAR